MKQLIIAAALLAASSSAWAGHLDFSYNTSGAVPMRYGFDKKENVSVAIHISGAELVGKKVTAISCPILVNTEATQIDSVYAFMTTELKKENKENVANICNVKATLTTPVPTSPEDNILTCTFPEPYTIGEEGVYVGYTVFSGSVSNSAGFKPITVVQGSQEGGLYVYATRSVMSWAEKSISLGAVSAMNVTISGDFNADAASFLLDQGYDAVKGERNDITVRVANYGTNPVSSIKYTTQLNGVQESGSLDFSTPIPNILGAYRSASISLPAINEVGEVPFTLTVTEVNGVPFESASTANISVSPFIAVNRPLVEEYTGLWCGWCPRGFAALEQLNEAYPNRFIALAYHNGDDMATIQRSQYPSSVSGYPAAFINRGSLMDPSDLLSRWPTASAEPASTLVETSLEWADDDQTVLRATTTAYFTTSSTGNTYRLSAALCADGLTDPNWVQANNLSGNSAYSKYGPMFEYFVKESPYVAGLTFNDVVLAFKDSSFGSVDDEITTVTAFEPYSHSTLYDLKTVRNLNGKTIIQDPEKLYCVGVLFDKRGAPVNCSRSPYAVGGNLDKINESSIRTIEASSVKAEQYFDLQGRAIPTPQPGQMVVRRVCLTDGSTAAFKQIYR